MALEVWVNKETGEEKVFDDSEQFFMVRTTDGLFYFDKLSAVDFFLLMDMGRKMSKSGRYSISVGYRAYLSKEFGISERTIQDSLKRMHDLNVITKIDTGYYAINPEVIFKFPARKMFDMAKRYRMLRGKIISGK